MFINENSRNLRRRKNNNSISKRIRNNESIAGVDSPLCGTSATKRVFERIRIARYVASEGEKAKKRTKRQKERRSSFRGESLVREILRNGVASLCIAYITLFTKYRVNSNEKQQHD